MASPDMNASASSTPSGQSQRSTGMIDRVKERAAAQLSNQKDKATDGLGSVAQMVRQGTQQLRDQQHDTLAGYVDSAADQIDRLSRQLRDKDVGELVELAQDMARRRPAMFIGSAFALGVVGARFFKSSSDDHDGRDTSFERSRSYRPSSGDVYGSSRGTTAYPGTSQPDVTSAGMPASTSGTGAGSMAGTGTGSMGSTSGASEGTSGSTSGTGASGKRVRGSAGSTGRS